MALDAVVWMDSAQVVGLAQATASRLLSNPTNQPLYQGAKNARKPKSRRATCKWSTTSLLGAQGCWFESHWGSHRRGSRLSPTALKFDWFHIIIRACCAFNHCFCGRLTWLVIVMVLHFRTIVLEPIKKKRSVSKSKFTLLRWYDLLGSGAQKFVLEAGMGLNEECWFGHCDQHSCPVLNEFLLAHFHINISLFLCISLSLSFSFSMSFQLSFFLYDPISFSVVILLYPVEVFLHLF